MPMSMPNIEALHTEIVVRWAGRMRGAAEEMGSAFEEARESILSGASPSMPGSPPGQITGNLKENWSEHLSGGGLNQSFHTEPLMGYAEFNEDGTSRMAARPFIQAVMDEVEPTLMIIALEAGPF